MLEICPLCVEGYGIVATVERTRLARLRKRRTPFDLQKCQFACDVSQKQARGRKEHCIVVDKVTAVAKVSSKDNSEVSRKIEKSVQCGKD